MMATSFFLLLFFLTITSSFASFSLNNKGADVQMNRGIGLEEIVLFLVGLGVAAALGLAIVMGPLFALFFSTINGTLPFGGANNGAATVSTSVGSKLLPDQTTGRLREILGEKLLEGMKTLEAAMRKYATD